MKLIAGAATTATKESRVLEDTENLLRGNVERLRLAIAAGAIGTWDYYPVTGLLDWDERCKEIHGVSPDAPVTYDLFERTIHPDDRARIEELIQRMLDPASGGLYVVEYRVVRLADRAERYISVRGSVVFDETGRAIRFIGTTQDITEQRLAAETRERVLGVVGHDLRGPLSTIRLAVSLVARELPAGRQKPIQIVERSVDRMEAIISEVLDYTRVRLGGGFELEPEIMDLGVLATEIVDEVAFSRGGPQPVLETRDDCHGTWDRTRLGQVLANLLHNARLYGAPGRPVTVSVSGCPDRVVVEVHNEGAPIPAELLPIIFQPFRRGTKTGKGLGLGLYITQQIVFSHRGTISVRSNQESGTTFRVELPRDPSAECIEP